MSASMDQFLAEHYGTNKTASAPANDEAEKIASVELFMKVASQENVDLTAMSDEQVTTLYNNWVKTASEEPKEEEEKKDEPKDEKVEEAKKEHEEKKAHAEKVAEADFMGRVMAHAYVQELNKIAAAATPEATETAKEAGKMPPALAAALGKGKDVAGKAVEGAKKHPAATHGAAAGAGAAAGMAAGRAGKKEKKASAVDELGFERAIKLASDAGFDTDEASARINAAFTLGLTDESKIASAADVDGAVEIRALEFLEAAGYPVTWNS